MNDDALPFIHRVVLKNYKSIAACDVRLGPLTFLVGPNGSGKSNFLDAIRFVSDALSTSLEFAVRMRGGIGELRRRSRGRPADIGVRLEFRLDSRVSGHYAFLIGSTGDEGFMVRDEECVIEGDVGHLTEPPPAVGAPEAIIGYRIRDGIVSIGKRVVGPAPGDRLYLPIAPRPEFWRLDRLLTAVQIYHPAPDQIRHIGAGGADARLMADGLNASSILRRMAREEPAVAERISQYLRQVMPGLDRVSVSSVDDGEALVFHQANGSRARSMRFPASSMSDGTLRALGVLLALFQTQRDEHMLAPPLVGIEEPEAALHPAGAGVLFDALREASRRRQVVVTSHSPDLLDNKEVDADTIRAVVAEGGETHIGPIEEIGRSALRDHLYTVGELLRMDQLRPETPSRKAMQQIRLFGEGAA